MTGSKATTDDVRYAYRLLLGREADPGGFQFYSRLIEEKRLSPTELASHFLESAEFWRLRNPGAGEEKGPPESVEKLGCCACTEARLQGPSFRYWAAQLREVPGHLHRKLWEWCFIAQALHERGALRGDSRGLGFAVGEEPLTALFATRKCQIVATDLSLDMAEKEGWVKGMQHASGMGYLNRRGICSPDEFERLVSFRSTDMRAIPEDIGKFDFLWSSCAMEHLGSLRQGMDFVLNAMRCLVPGGVAVHTTELNCDSNEHTITEGHDVIYRRRDLLQLGQKLAASGHLVESFNFDLGNSDPDRYIDEPPYQGPSHLKLRIGGYASTSFGLIVTARAGS